MGYVAIIDAVGILKKSDAWEAFQESPTEPFGGNTSNPRCGPCDRRSAALKTEMTVSGPVAGHDCLNAIATRATRRLIGRMMLSPLGVERFVFGPPTERPAPQGARIPRCFALLALTRAAATRSQSDTDPQFERQKGGSNPLLSRLGADYAKSGPSCHKSAASGFDSSRRAAAP